MSDTYMGGPISGMPIPIREMWHLAEAKKEIMHLNELTGMKLAIPRLDPVAAMQVPKHAAAWAI